MTQNNPDRPGNRKGRSPVHQTSEDLGTIQSPQRTEATMRNKDLPRGSERENRARSTQR